MFTLQQVLVCAPGFFTPLALLWSGKKIAPFQRKGAAFSTLNSSPHSILPVRRMQAHFPDVMAPRAGTPGGLLCGHALDGLFKVRSMPSLFLIGFIEQSEHERCGIHGGLHKAWVGDGENPAKDGAPALSCQRRARDVGTPEQNEGETKAGDQLQVICITYRIKLV